MHLCKEELGQVVEVSYISTADTWPGRFQSNSCQGNLVRLELSKQTEGPGELLPEQVIAKTLACYLVWLQIDQPSQDLARRRLGKQ